MLKMKRFSALSNPLRLFSSARPAATDPDQMKIPNFNREHQDLNNEYES